MLTCELFLCAVMENMFRRIVAEVFVLAFMLVWTPNLRLSRTTDAYATDIVVPDQYSTIQAAINNAADGDMIFVKSGTYFEHVVVNKTVSLVGEDSRTTVVDANGSGRVFSISRDYVNITGFTMRKSGGVYAQDAGVWIEGAGHCSIFGNNVTENDFFGISVWDSSSNNITGNIVSKTKVMGIHIKTGSKNIVSGNRIEDYYCGISTHAGSYNNRIVGNSIRQGDCGILLDNSHNSVISGNNITENRWKYGYNLTDEKYGISIQADSSGNVILGNYIADNDGNGTQVVEGAYGNRFYHNNFINNEKQAYVPAGFTNYWDDDYPSGGNYWSDYNGTDANHDGIGDTPYTVGADNQDRYPLASPLTGAFVPDQYSTIQAAINHANDGDTVFVKAGVYYEHVVVNNTVALIGENRDSTIIDGSGTGVVVDIAQNGVRVLGFTIRNSGRNWNIGGGPYAAGVLMINVSNCNISYDRIIQNGVGVQAEYGADGNVIANNTIADNGVGFGTFDASWNSFVGNNVTGYGRGLGLNVNSDYNIISENVIIAEEWAVAVHMCHYNNLTRNFIGDGLIGVFLPQSSYNRVYHNSIVNNREQAKTIYEGSPPLFNYWDAGYPSGGNYWADHVSSDVNADKICDLAYQIDENNTDRNPLVYPYEFYALGYRPKPDLNNDGIINIVDVTIVARAFSSKPGDPNWNPVADMDISESINIVDMAKVAKDYGKTV